MRSTKRFFLPNWMQRYHLRHYVLDSILVVGGIASVTGILSFFHISSQISDSVLFYLILIFAFASFRGFYAAVCASFLAFFPFDYFFVPPIYGWITNKIEDLLALLVFLLTAITTNQLAWVLRKRANEAGRRERETHILYELVRATNSEEDMLHQLTIFTLVPFWKPRRFNGSGGKKDGRNRFSVSTIIARAIAVMHHRTETMANSLHRSFRRCNIE